MADIDEDGEKKEGPELFKELFRLLPSVCVEDYYKLGRWQDADIKLDIELLSSHRKEAGAPEPSPIEDLELPQLPVNGAGPGVGLRMGMGFGAAGAYGPGAYPAGAARPATTAMSGIKPAAPKASVGTTSLAKPAATSSLLKPSPPKAAPSPGQVAAAGGASSGPSAELRQIALFIAKWKLEATKTKLLLARLTPTKRRFVMAKFTASSGSATTPQLEQYISQCERTNSWANADTSTPAAGQATSGLKRPLGSGAPVSDPKKQKIVPTGPSRVGGPAFVSRPPAQAAAGGRIGAAKPGPYGSAAAKPSGPKPAGAKPTAGAKPGAGFRNTYSPAKPAGPKPAGPKPAGPKTASYPSRPGTTTSVYKPATAKPGAAKIGSGAIKPSPPKAGAAKAGGAKPGSLIKNLLNL